MYDLILRDATIVTSSGRQVADVAVKDGKIAYVGPRPPRNRTRREISAMGKFLMPGVIDTAVQFDPLGEPDVWARESKAAVSGGVTTVLTLPTGKTPVVDRPSATARAKQIDGNSWCHYGLWGALNTSNASELDTAFTEGLLVGSLAYVTETPNGIGVRPDDLAGLMDTQGVLGFQLDAVTGGPSGSMTKVMEVLRGHQRNVHLVHLSTVEELQMLDPMRGDVPVTAGVTPHHLFLSEESLGNGSTVRTRPPVRPEHDRRTLWTAVKRGRLDCMASDHHPVRPTDGLEGVPGAELMFPLMLSAVRYGRLSLELLVALCAERPAKIFGLESKGRIERGADADLVLFVEGEVERVQEKDLLSSAGWSPYDRREAAPKPDLVIVDGEVVAERGEIVSSAPRGRRV